MKANQSVSSGQFILVTPLQCRILDEISKHPNGVSSNQIVENTKDKAPSVRVNLSVLQKLGLVQKTGTHHSMIYLPTGLEYKLFNRRWLGKDQSLDDVDIDELEAKAKARAERKKIQITEDMLPKWPVPPSVIARAQDHYPSYRS